jgi:hypothetical protein
MMNDFLFRYIKNFYQCPVVRGQDLRDECPILEKAWLLAAA